MNNPEPSDEPSCKRQENGDASTGSDRPLKKARFAWQVKGKYHLKNDTADVKCSVNSCDDPHEPGPSSQNSSSSSDLIGSAEQNLEILGDYLLKQDFNTLDSVITDTDKSLLCPCPTDLSEKPQYPTYIPSTQRLACADEGSHNHGIPMSLVVSNTYNEDQCIARWQARQMAKGFVDNTINRVLDSWMTAHLPTGMEENGFLALDVAEFINNLPGDNSIENEGILMAISAHGLQNNSSSSDNDNQDDDPPSKHVFSRSSSPVLETKQRETKDKLESDTNSTNDFHMAWLYDDERDNTSSSSYFRDTSSPTYLNYSDNDQLQNSNIEFEDVNAATNDFTSHFDFMDAAVSFAIQNKGLTSFGTDYG